MSTMVMCADQPSGSGMFQRYPSPPALNYPPFNTYTGYGTPGAQHPQDYNQYQVPEPGMQSWYATMYGSHEAGGGWAYPTSAMGNASSHGMGNPGQCRSMGLDFSQAAGAQMSSDSPADTSSSSSSSVSPSNKQLRPPYDWMKKPSYQSAPTSGKTRTKDKYRVVYSDMQRLELEKEFHYSRYITIRRKAELATHLGLSERQVKIWFQNRRAKERKQNKKHDENSVIKMSDIGEFSDDNKQHVQQQMNMQMTSHPQHVQVTSPSPTPTMHGHNPYGYQGHAGQVHLSPQHGTLSTSPQHHVTGPGQQYSSPNSLHLPISPANDVMNAPNSCSISPQPLAIKEDIDAIDGTTS